jgi:hypothetical protein
LNKSEVASSGLPRLLKDTAAPNPEDVSKAIKDLKPPTNYANDLLAASGDGDGDDGCDDEDLDDY